MNTRPLITSSDARERRLAPDYARYEAGKRELRQQDLTPQQYESAIQALAERCGV